MVSLAACGLAEAFAKPQAANRCSSLITFYRINLMTTPTSARKYLAFDIETAKEVPGDFSQWRSHRPLGIICAATCASDAEPRVWHSKTADDQPAPQMTQADVRQLVGYLAIM